MVLISATEKGSEGVVEGEGGKFGNCAYLWKNAGSHPGTGITDVCSR